MATTTSVLGLTKPAYSEAADVSVLNSDMDLIDAEAGRVRGNIAANYSASSAYAVGDLCLYTGVLYRCKTAIGSGGEAWNSGHWDAVKIAGQLSALSDQIASLNGNIQTLINGKVTKVRHNITGHSAVADSDVQSWIQTYSDYGAVVVEFYRSDNQVLVGSMLYNVTSPSYGAGVLISYYKDGAILVMNVNGTITLKKLATVS